MKIAQGIRPCGAFIFHISVKSEQKFQFRGSYTLVVAPMGVKFGMEEGTFGPLLRAKFHPHRCNVSPLLGEKPQNRPLSKLNTGRFALRAMLPVIKHRNQVLVLMLGLEDHVLGVGLGLLTLVLVSYHVLGIESSKLIKRLRQLRVNLIVGMIK